MTSPDGKIRIPLNESQDDKSQIEEFLHDYKGEGIQHVALGTDDIYATVDRMRARGVQFQDTPRDLLRGDRRARARHGEDLRAQLRERRILIDGAPTQGQGLLLQIFTAECDRPVLLRDHPAQGQRGLRRGQLQGAVRVARARSDPSRRALACATAQGCVARLRARPVDAPHAYQCGFGNHFATEALPGALPAQNSPQRCPYGLYAEQLSGTAFTAPRAGNRRSWLYRIRPAVQHGAVRRAAATARSIANVFAAEVPPPNQLRWDPLPIPHGAERFHRRPADAMAANGGSAAAMRCRHPSLCRQPVDAAAAPSTMRTASC